MKAVIAIDSFKGSMSSIEAGLAAKEGILRVFEDAEVSVYPIADGGEGTVDALVTGMGGELIYVKVKNPLGDIITASYGIVNSTTAIMEMSAAAGITLIAHDLLNPMNTTTYGVGQMIKDAISRGCRNFVIGIGGSATNDGGIGMLQALGFDLLNSDGEPVSLGAKGLSEIAEIGCYNAPRELKDCTFNIACDVKNPLCGANGCSRIFAPQKGATAEQIEIMDRDLDRFAEMTAGLIPSADKNAAGAGAAGGLGFAFSAYLNGTLKPGIELILDLIKLEQSIKTADIVLTGEGRLDAQTVMGKAPIGIARLAKKHAKPVFAFAGAVLRDARACNAAGIDAYFPIVRTPCALDQAMDKKTAKENMSDTVEQAIRIFAI